jgi:hypothetical protein
MYSIKKRNNLWLAFLFMVMSALFPCASLALPVDWATSTIDTGDVGLYTSVAIDSNDHVHISYYDATNHALKYATNALGDWVTSTIDTGDVGLYTSVAIDSNDHVHISYYDATNHALKYATNALGDWATSTIDSTGDVGLYTSVAIDSNNHVHISYYAVGYQVYAVGNLKYATNASGGWVTSTIDIPGGVGMGLYTSIGVGLYTSIAVDSNNIVHISYYDGINHDLKYFTIAPGSLGSEIPDSTGDVGQFSSIAVDSNNNVHISYLDYTNGELKYAKTSPYCPPPLTPNRASPANGVTGISTTPTFGWSRGGTTYSVQVCSDSACNNVVTSASALTSRWWTVSPALNNNTQYWWRIKAGNSCGSSSQWSGTSSFITMTLPQSTAWTPKISVAPLSVNLGSVPVGGTSNPKIVTIKNTGNEDLIVNSTTITGANQSEFIQTVNCSIVSAKSDCSVIVTFSPVAPFGKKSGIMSISFNDLKKTTMNVKLSGQAPPPKISVSPHSVNFGSVAVGTTSATKVVTIRNTGLSDLTINEITFTGTNASEFTHTSDCTTVAKGGSCTITIALSPTLADIKTATMSISSSDPKKSSVNVKLKGKGI